QLRRSQLPLYSLENFVPLRNFDVVGFSLQYEICASNILTMLDLGGIPLRSVSRTLNDPLIVAGGPCAQNPEPIAPFIDVFVTGDGEPSLPRICDEWLRLKAEAAAMQANTGGPPAKPGAKSEPGANGDGTRVREELLARLAARLPFAFVPRVYEAECVVGELVG